MADRTIEIIVDVADKTGGKLSALKNSLLALDSAVQRIHNKFRALALQRFAASIRLIDNVTTPGSRINSFLKSLASRVYQVTMRVNDSALGKIRQIEASLMRLAGRAYNIAVNVKDNISGKLGGLANGALMSLGAVGGAMGLGYGAVNAVQSYADFEKNMSRVQAVGNLEKDSPEMKALTDLAKNLGATTEWTASEAAQAMYYQAMAGWSPDKILAATPAIMNLASAGGTDLATTSDILTDTMTGFGIKAGEKFIDPSGHSVEVAQHYADMMAKLVTSSNTNIPQLGEALKYSANVVGSMYSGKDIQTRMNAVEDAMVMTGLMANAGIKGSQAGTSTRAVFTRFGAENRNASRALEALGVDFTDKDTGDVRRISSIMKDLNSRFKEGVNPQHLLDFAEAMTGEKIHADTRRKLDSFIESTSKNGGKMSGADMLKMSSMLAGQEAMSGFLAAIMGDWDELAVKIENAHGAAQKMAEVQLDNLSGDVVRLGSAWDAFQRGLFEGQAGEGLRSFVQTLTEIVNRANNLFKDGIQIGDIATLIGDVINRLKNKFLELDGVGSILAGGALIAGLMKIVSTAQRAAGSLKNLRGVESAAAGSISAGQRVGTMNISAGVVNVNGRVGGSAGGRSVGNRGVMDNYYRTKETIRGSNPPAPPVISPLSGMKSAGLTGAAVAGVFGLMDMMSVKSANQERLTEAKIQVETAQNKYREQIAGGATPEIIAEYAAAITAAQANVQTIERENNISEFKAGTETAAAIVGTGLGAALGSLAGPFGTMIGGVIGGILGEKVGGLIADETADKTSETAAQDYFGFNKPATAALPIQDNSAILRRHQADIEESARRPHEKVFGIAQAQANRRAADIQERATIEQARRFEVMDAKLSETGQGLHFDTNQATFDYYAAQREQLQNFQPPEMPNLLDLFSSRAAAAELTPEQLVQQSAMERGEFYPAETLEPLEMPELNTESLTANLEGVSEIFSEFGASITENLSAAFEGVGEIFSGIGEQIGAGMESALSVATGALEGIQTAFTSAKDSICAAWSELPGFFSGVFSGLGGAAEAAGSAILSGLTSVCGAVIGAWQAVASAVSSIISSISAAASSVAGMIPSFGGGVKAYAEGGFVDSPTFLVGEAGGEVVIPLSPSKRSRALDLFEKTGEILGGEAVNFSGDEVLSELPNEEFSDNFSVPSVQNDDSDTQPAAQSSSSSISLGGMNINFEIHGDNPQEILQTIQENISELSDRIAAQMSKMIANIHQNQLLEA